MKCFYYNLALWAKCKSQASLIKSIWNTIHPPHSHQFFLSELSCLPQKKTGIKCIVSKNQINPVDPAVVEPGHGCLENKWSTCWQKENLNLGRWKSCLSIPRRSLQKDRDCVCARGSKPCLQCRADGGVCGGHRGPCVNGDREELWALMESLCMIPRHYCTI